MLKRFAFFLGLMALALPGRSAVNSVASLAAPLDNAGVSARALGMGSAFVGVADDSSALFWNPAGLGGLENLELALHHNSLLDGIVQEIGVVGLPMGALGGFGFSANYVNYGGLPGYDENGNPTGDYSANRYGFGAGWGKEVLDQLSVGLALKGDTQTIAGNNYSDLAIDLGALWQPVRELKVGLDYSNLGTHVAGYALASDLSLGASYRLDFRRDNQLLLALSGTLEPQGVNRIQMGAEDTICSLIALRIGYRASLADTQIQGLSGFSTGVGILYEGLSLDYAYLPSGDLGTTHRISLSYEFGQDGEQAKASRHKG